MMKRICAALLACALLLSHALAETALPMTEARLNEALETICAQLLQEDRAAVLGDIALTCQSDADGALLSVGAEITADPADTDAASGQLQLFGLVTGAVVYACELIRLDDDLTALAEQATSLSEALERIGDVTEAAPAEIAVAGGVLRLSVRTAEDGVMTWTMSFTAE